MIKDNTQVIISHLNNQKALIVERKNNIIKAKSECGFMTTRHDEISEELRKLDVTEISEAGIQQALDNLDKQGEEITKAIMDAFEDLKNV